MMTVLVISSFITLGFIKLLVSQQQQYHYQYGLLQLQYHGALLSQLLQQQIRASGYLGCLQFTKDNVINDSSPTPLVANGKGLAIYPATRFWQDALKLHQSVKPNTKLIMSQRMGEDAVPLMVNMHQSTQLVISDRLQVKPGQKMIVADCTQGSIFTVKQVKKMKHQSQQLVITTSPIKRYHQGAQVGHYRYNIFFIAKTDRFNGRHQGIDALYVNDNGLTHEMLAGVENLQVSYQQHAPSMLQLHLLLNSIDPISQQADHYSYEGMQYTDSTGVKHIQWDIAIALENYQ